MTIVKFADGSLKEVDFDVTKPNIRDLDGVEEVYVISKVLVPTVVLKPKPKEVRDALKTGDSVDKSEKPKRRRNTKKPK